MNFGTAPSPLTAREAQAFSLSLSPRIPTFTLTVNLNHNIQVSDLSSCQPVRVCAGSQRAPTLELLCSLTVTAGRGDSESEVSDRELRLQLPCHSVAIRLALESAAIRRSQVTRYYHVVPCHSIYSYHSGSGWQPSRGLSSG